MRSVLHLLQDTLHLLYPYICTGCGSDLLEPPNQLCLHCLNELPHTKEAFYKNNHTEKIFIGRLPVTGAFSEFYFAKGSLIQHLIHQLKYKGNQEIGFFLGTMMGRSILDNDRFKDLDQLVPLPLNPKKEFKRGYNQAAVICQGISSITNIPVSLGNVTRRRFTETQTRKHRTERWENVDGSFMVCREEALSGKHILLVDDVITTGATLESCGQVILEIPGTRLSIATLAFASK